MKEYIILSYKNNNSTLDVNNLTRTNVYNIILNKINKLQNILDSIYLLSQDSIKNLENFIQIDLASKERDVIEKIIKKQDYSKELEKLNHKEKKVLNLFEQIINFLEKNLNKLKDNDDDYIETINYETTIAKHNVDKILKIGEQKLNQIEKILSKLKILMDLLTSEKNQPDIFDYTLKRINKLEKDVNTLHNQETKILEYDKYYEYHTATITENDNGELSLSI
jgi:hypothetical protein